MKYSFKGTKEDFKILTGTTEGTAMCLPNNSIYAGKIRLAQVYGKTKEEAQANCLLMSMSKKMLQMLSKKRDYLEEISVLIPSEEWTEEFRDKWCVQMNELENLIEDATTL